MLASRALFRVDRFLKLTNLRVKSKQFYRAQASCSYRSNRKMSDSKDTQGDHNKKRRTVNLVWRPVSTKADSIEEGGQLQEVQASVSSDVLTDHNDEKLPGEESEVEGLHAVISSKLSRDDHLMEALNEMSVDNICSSSLEKDIDDKPLDTESVSNGNHSLSIEGGASLIRFIRGKEGSTQKKIEEELGVKITVPSSNKEDSVVIEGDSIDSVTRASEKIQHIIDEAVNSPKLEYSHFVSLPLAVHPELVDKLVNFQNCILGNNESGLDESKESDSNEDVSDDESKDQDLEGERVAVQLQVKDDEKHVKVDVTNIPLVSYAPKASKSSSISLANLGIEKSIFIKPKTFHLTVLMLKLWNKERVNRAAEVLQTVSSKVLDALDRRPISIRLKGLDCMRGSLAKARVVYAPVEEVGSEDRLLHACQIIINAFVEAGLVLEKDANQKLKLHATVMNARHRKRKTRSRKFDSFDARGIFKQFGSEEWGEYLIREAHLSQRFKYDENGYYHCCASIPFPEEMQFD